MTNDEIRITNQIRNPNDRKEDKRYDLTRRTTEFAKKVVAFAKKIPRNEVTRPLIEQSVSAGTSVGANYREADSAESKKDFHHKIGLCKKEASETMYWLEVIVSAVSVLREEARLLWKEAHELTLIFGAINRKQ